MNKTKERLEQLNHKIIDAGDNADLIESYSEEYFKRLREYLPQVMGNLERENDTQKCRVILASIFPIQEALMSIRIRADKIIDNDLWEIAKDFDNDDPLRYEYLIKKIKNSEYEIQNT